MKVEHYIKRRLIKADDTFAETGYALSQKFTEIQKIIDRKNIDSNKIIILGEAGSGKSTELYNASSELYIERDYNNVPIFIPLNTYTGDNFKDYISMKLGESAKHLLNYDKSKLVFFLDEFDQVMNKELATRHILNFADLYKDSMFVISCRTNFYSNNFPDFDRYFLAPFDNDNISQFSRLELPTVYHQLISKIKSMHFDEIAKVPFFLKTLVDIFKENCDLPNHIAELLDIVISNSIKKDIERLSEYDLGNKYPADEIKKDLTLISITLEILQRNYLYSSEINAILNNDFKSEVIKKRLGLITTKDGESFQFQHNNFNEYLAAKFLSERDFKVILDLISIKAPLININAKTWVIKSLKYFSLDMFGLKIKDILSDVLTMETRLRINPSWVNTIGFISQLRSSNDLINYLLKYEPELALKIESSRLNENDRYTIFKSIFDSYLDKKIPIKSELDFPRLKNIIDQSGSKKEDIFSYLMKHAHSKVHYNHRYNALNLLSYVKGYKDNEIIETMVNKIKETYEVATVKHICMLSLVKIGATDRNIIDRIIEISDTDSDFTLSGLYYLLFNSNDIDAYVDILLAGISKSKMDYDSNKVRLSDERYYLSKCLGKISSPIALKSIIDFLSHNSNLFHDYDIKKIIPSLMNTLTQAYKVDKKVYIYASDLLICAEKNHSDQLHEIGLFFVNTNTSLTMFKELYSQGIDNHHYSMAVITNEECLSFLLEEHSQQRLTDDNVWMFIRHLSFRNRDKYQESIDFINKQTGNIFVPEPPIDYQARDRKELLRKIDIIFNKTDFLQEVGEIYSKSGKVTLNHKDILEIRKENLREIEDKYNDFILNEINYISSKGNNRDWTEEELIAEINSYNYDYFTFEHIFELLYNDEKGVELTDDQIQFLKDFCNDNLGKIDFKSALSVERKEPDNNITLTANSLAVKLWFFKRRYHFDYPEDVLLDMLSFDWIEVSGYCGIEYLDSELNKDKASTRVRQNLEKGINIAPVLINHINYCLRNNINDIIADIVVSMNNELIDTHERKNIIELLNKFQNGKEYIINYLSSDNAEIFNKAAELLLKDDTSDVKEIIRQRMMDKNIDIAVESARLLIPYQEIDVIKFYVSHIITHKKYGEDMHSPLAKIENIAALDELKRMLLFYFENRKEITDNHSLLLMNLIKAYKNIARKSLKNMKKVLRTISKFIDANEKSFEDVIYLNSVCDEIESEYYTNYKGEISEQEAIQKAKRLFL